VPRRRRILLALLALVVLAAGSFVAARVLSAGAAERDAALALIERQARGDAAGVVARLAGCGASAACRAAARATVARVRGPGRFQALRVESASQFALGPRTTTVRIAWRTGARLPFVQCVDVRRRGSILGGFRVAAVRLSAPIARDASC